MFNRHKLIKPFSAIAVGLVFCFVGWIIAAPSEALLFHGQDSKLTIVDIRAKNDDNEWLFKPIFEAKHEDGTRIRHEARWWANWKFHKVGDIVDGKVNWQTGKASSQKRLISLILFGRLFWVVGLYLILRGFYQFYRRARFRN